MVDLVSHFPYPTPRPIQAAALQELERVWETSDCIVIRAPTAFGKTGLSETLCRALQSVSVITPTNQLVAQYRAEFPYLPSLARLDSYWCSEYQMPCATRRNMPPARSFCRKGTGPGCTPGGCEASRDLSTARHRRGPGIYNYHTYLAHKLYRDTVVVDEAHNLIPLITERSSKTYWQHAAHYPPDMRSSEQVLAWLRRMTPRKRAKYELLEEAVTSPRPRYVWYRRLADYNGAGTKRGEPEERDQLVLEPVDISQAPPIIWPGLSRGGDVRKLVLLSATLSRSDIRSMGIPGRVTYLDCASPIPAEQRPVLVQPLLDLSRSAADVDLPAAVQYIQEVAEHHTGERGLVHVTYELGRRLRDSALGADPRFMWHDSGDSKKEAYRAWLDSPMQEGRVLMASGMYEGVDLPGDLGRWQILLKVPWPSLGNPATRLRSEMDPEWYNWQTLRTVIQACGRICRTPEDYGVSYCPDVSLPRLFREAADLVPEWYADALVY